MSSLLKPEELAGYRKTLSDLRARLRGDLDQLTDEALNGSGGEATGNLSNMPLHMADLGTETYEQDFNLSLIETEQSTLALVDEALGRIDAGTFGTCEECNGSIARNRLQAIPYTRHCIECARKVERA
ncbi:MAG: TraR/DksA family transcriptional regulator [Isosphaeraceae bacterium]